MKISVLIDCCAWNYLFNNRVDLAADLPPNEFEIFITPALRIELSSIPDTGVDGDDKRALKAYIESQLRARQPRTLAPFGFAVQEKDGSLAKFQPYGGFGQGTFESRERRDWLASAEIQRLIINKKKNKKTGIPKNFTDADLSAYAKDTIVLTADKKNGPLQLAKDAGKKVLYLGDLDQSDRQTLSEVIHSMCERMD